LITAFAASTQLESLSVTNPFSFTNLDSRLSAPTDGDLYSRLETHFLTSAGNPLEKLYNFPRFLPRSAQARYLARYELYKLVLEVHGDIVECGVHLGGGLFAQAHFCEMFEPNNYTRRVIGFDTYGGFPSVSEKDIVGGNANTEVGGYSAPVLGDLHESRNLFDQGRLLKHAERIEFVAGDALQTIPKWAAENNHTSVALLYLDFDLYAPTLAALEHLLPRMPKGAIIAFDQVGDKSFPGECQAVIEKIGLSSLALRRFPFYPRTSYAVLQ
jgi:Macrocin-O-methyltransferase (TylF)